MLISNIINDSFGLLSKQLRFYCWHFRRDLDRTQRQELIELLHEQHFERLANKIKLLNQSTVADCRQQIGKLLFDYCLTRNRRHQLTQLIESDLVDINVRLDNYGRTLLHRSAYNLDVEMVKLLIEHGVNIRLRDYAGNTALHIAIQSYRNGALIFGNGPDVVQNLTSIIQLLLEADKNLQNERYSCKRIKLMLNQELSSNVTESSKQNKNQDSTDQSRAVDETSTSSNPSSLRLHVSSGEQRDGISGLSTSQLTKQSGGNYNLGMKLTKTKKESLICPITEQELSKQTNQSDYASESINPILLEDASSPLVDTKNAFGRTALHYCVLVVGEQHLGHFVQLLISFGADTDATDTRMKTPLYCLVKRPSISAVRQKCLAIAHLLNSGCDDLGLAIQPKSHFTDELIKKLEKNISTILQLKSESQVEPIFTRSTFKRVPSLKHLARLRLIKLQDVKNKMKRQMKFSLPITTPASLNLYVNRKILDQSELF